MSKLRFPKPTGFVAPGFERVLQIFRENYENGMEKGSSFAAYYKGQPVVNLWGGLADWEVKREWKEDTMGLFYSTTKFMAAITIAHLVERNLLTYEEKVSKYWPEFGQNGKENITVEELLAYRAGLSILSNDFYCSWIRDDPQRLHDMLVKQKPLWPPGTAHGYHMYTIGLYLNELVKQVDVKGRTLSKYFDDEIAQPIGIDFYIGVPKSLYYRVARLEPVPVDKVKYMQALASSKGDAQMLQKALYQLKDWSSIRALNNPDFLELPVPSSHGAGTALAVAKLMGILANGGQHEGKTVLSPASILKLQEPLSYGIDLFSGFGDIYGRGSWLIPIVEGEQNWYMYGHAGFGDQMGAADPHYKTGFAYTTNRVDPMLTLVKDRSMNKEDEDEGSLVDDVGVETDDESDVNFDVEEGEVDGLHLDSSDDDESE
ncbi:beta-lactamase domain-containing protein 2-like [Plakobranchus ocellatus]|uniref:Beta-lactamase domain-containing protein 2-like n=1 Tax=Plakobranchus ocellatus TaxID=259542 RepID=A0AAV4D5C9_9GAST|nr:beta-lactamase domain-containing protein 2-like [Plakobranchus ocellatus]